MAEDDSLVVVPMARIAEGERWLPVVGPETVDFVTRIVPEASQQDVVEAATSVLSRGIASSGEAGCETGLVVGYVQSGKTMSFEAVAALAHDNGFQVVVVIAGVANPLLEQSSGRLRVDLRLDDEDRGRRWVQFQNPGMQDGTIRAIRDILQDRHDPNTPDSLKKTILVTVLKHHRRLQSLAAVFTGVGMGGVPVLVIDDEADQASLNNEAAQGTESTTYRRLMELREALPSHTYLQYTATPQAPLLISIIDSLSPGFVEVLNPGQEYVGGRAFFTERTELVRTIPSNEVPTASNPLSGPPESLLEALRIFIVGAAAGLSENGDRGNRSMMVHPSQRVAHHQEFYAWVCEILESWKRILDLPETDHDRRELLEDLRSAHEDLVLTVGPSMPRFEELVTWLRTALRNTRILEVNARSGGTPRVDWRSAYAWILVGGQAMDRGFTIEGLTVTYMPRGIGAGNADTIQQRARFFGYKRRYLGYCRTYLELGTRDAFRSYVRHEEDIRSQLSEFQASGRPLREWKRAFVLDAALRPCRDNVLEFDYMRGRFSDAWVNPRVVLGSAEVVEANLDAVRQFTQGLVFVDDEGRSERTSTQRHRVCREVSLRAVIEGLLVPTRITGSSDSQRNTGLLLQLSRALERDPSETCTVYQMSGGRVRERGVDANGEITNLFQGEAPVMPRELRGTLYPGDRAIKDPDTISVQIHMLDLTQENQTIMENVPVVAVWVPARLECGWLIQEQPIGSE